MEAFGGEAFSGFEAVVRQLTLTLATAVEAAFGVLVGLAVLKAVWRSLRLFLARRGLPEAQKEAIRLRLGRWLAVVLEFLLAADILRTAVAPTWSDIGKLAATLGHPHGPELLPRARGARGERAAGGRPGHGPAAPAGVRRCSDGWPGCGWRPTWRARWCWSPPCWRP